MPASPYQARTRGGIRALEATLDGAVTSLTEAIADANSAETRTAEAYQEAEAAYKRVTDASHIPFQDWVLQQQQVVQNKAILRRLAILAHQPHYTNLARDKKKVAANIIKAFRLDCFSELYTAFGSAILDSRKSLEIVKKIKKQLPSITFQDLIEALVAARKRRDNRKKGLNSDLTRFVLEDFQSAYSVLVPAATDDSAGRNQTAGKRVLRGNRNATVHQRHSESPTSSSVPALNTCGQEVDAEGTEHQHESVIEGGHRRSSIVIAEVSSNKEAPPVQGFDTPSVRVTTNSFDELPPRTPEQGRKAYVEAWYEESPLSLEAIRSTAKSTNFRNLSSPSLGLRTTSDSHLRCEPEEDYGEGYREDYCYRSASSESEADMEDESEVNMKNNTSEWRASLAEDESISVHRQLLTSSDLARLDHGALLNDALMNALVSDVVSQETDEVLFLNSFFYPTLTVDGVEKVQRWTKNVELDKVRYIITIINRSCHWILAIIVLPAMQPQSLEIPLILTVDSMDHEGSKPNRTVFNDLVRYTNVLFPSLKISKIVWKPATGFVRQDPEDNSDCGIYALMALQEFLKNPKGFIVEVCESARPPSGSKYDPVKGRLEFQERIMGFLKQDATKAQQSGGLFGNTSASRPAAIGGLFGSSTTTTSNPQKINEMFGSSAMTSQPQQTSGISSSSPATTSQPEQIGKKFGSSTTTSHPQQTGGIFSNPVQNQNQGTSGGLLGSGALTQPAQSDGHLDSINRDKLDLGMELSLKIALQCFNVLPLSQEEDTDGEHCLVDPDQWRNVMSADPGTDVSRFMNHSKQALASELNQHNKKRTLLVGWEESLAPLDKESQALIKDLQSADDIFRILGKVTEIIEQRLDRWKEDFCQNAQALSQDHEKLLRTTDVKSRLANAYPRILHCRRIAERLISALESRQEFVAQETFRIEELVEAEYGRFMERKRRRSISQGLRPHGSISQ